MNKGCDLWSTCNGDVLPKRTAVTVWGLAMAVRLAGRQGITKGQAWRVSLLFHGRPRKVGTTLGPCREGGPRSRIARPTFTAHVYRRLVYRQYRSIFHKPMQLLMLCHRSHVAFRVRSSTLLRVACSHGRQAGAAIGVPRSTRRARRLRRTKRLMPTFCPGPRCR